jgi:hypothetical protein
MEKFVQSTDYDPNWQQRYRQSTPNKPSEYGKSGFGFVKGIKSMIRAGMGQAESRLEAARKTKKRSKSLQRNIRLRRELLGRDPNTLD